MSLFSERFRQLKEEKGLTLKEISEDLNISVPNLSYYMKGREPNYDTLIKIADYFDVTADWLIGRSNIKTFANTNFFESIDKLSNVELPDECLKKYHDIETIMKSVLDDVYFILHRNDDDAFLNDFFNKFQMIFRAFLYAIRAYVQPLIPGNPIKDSILQYINDTDLIADSLRIIMLMCSYSYADYLTDTSFQLSGSNAKIIKEIINFTQKQFKEKYPDQKIQEMFDRLNEL